MLENRNECLRLANQILTHYTDIFGAGCVPELLYFSENLTYLVKDDKGVERAIMRLSRPGYHTPDELEAEVRWMVHAGFSGVTKFYGDGTSRVAVD